MDADTLRAILDAQSIAQQKTLDTLMDKMEEMFKTMAATPAGTRASTTEFVTNSLSARLPEFTYDPENGCTFDVWYNRYEDVITQDGATLDDAAKARLIVSKLDAAAFARFTNHILPKKPAEVSVQDTVKTLQELFGHNTSIFARRYTYLRTQCSGRGNCHVADTTSLLGLDWITQVEPLFHQLTGNTTCNAVSATTLAKLRSSLTAQLQKQFAAVFAPGLGCCTKSKASLKLKPDATPVFRKARPVPYAVLPRLSQEIDRLIAANVLSPVDHSDWAAPIVVVQKKNGSIRLCADFSTGLNNALDQHQHPLPTPDDIFTKLNGGQYFSQLDLAEAYLQLEVDEESRPLLTINTHQGLYRLNRLPFGVKSAPAIFQQQMDTMIAGLDGTAAYLDDIIVTGKTINEHNVRLEAVLRRIHDYGFRVRLEKCSFLQTEIRYLGFIVNAKGRQPDPAKIEAIHNMPPPKNVSQLRAFLGLVNFYGNFVKNLHNLRVPLDALTKKDATFLWTPACQSSFDRIKAILKSDLLLTHYDPSLPIVVAADASNYGIGAVLSHQFPGIRKGHLSCKQDLNTSSEEIQPNREGSFCSYICGSEIPPLRPRSSLYLVD
ncbi:reverse transcriptase [Teladorsagia circumcincta]|uniref:RNA-directed DNA polymerase n=1 Tax=Teladorsagia circumcincta TaxID=45464 RepID=A0A2G9TDS1_TELCI|nr:reverse transcriptase [Teladorsagia circumcincta]